MRIRSTDFLIAALGALLAHEVAYGVVGLTAGPSHEHLPALLATVLPIGAVLIARMALRPFAARLASTSTRAALQVALFLLLEGAEHGGALTDLAGNPAVLLGLALQPAVAWFIGASVRHAREMATRVVGSDPGGELPSAITTAIRLDRLIPAPHGLLPRRRGPPSPVLT
ncbi:MAG: hypothetical protein HKN46_08540 [Acidimicrobiia bacterium]|nr:hypothetical protein [Acidimicrobiia bacterium]